MKLLIAGCGYVGTEVRKEVPGDWQVWALTRSPDRKSVLADADILPVVGDWLNPASLNELPEVDLVLVSVPHRPHPRFEERTHQVGLQNLIDQLPNGWRKLVYLSTTGVYGDCQHDLVNEQTPVSPTRIGPAMAVAAERWLERNLPPEKRVILRLAGIYGPGRVPLAAKLKNGEPLPVPLHGYLNLGHVSDIARVILKLLTTDTAHSLYVFSDGHPVPRVEFYRHLAGLCGIEEPRFADPSTNSTSSVSGPDTSRARRATSKRVDPSRIVAELGYTYEYPSYRSGLANALAIDSTTR